MVKCPKCQQLTDYKRHCSHCGAIIKQTVAEKFDKMSGAVEQALKQEAKRRRRKKQLRAALIAAVVIAAAVYVGIKI